MPMRRYTQVLTPGPVNIALWGKVSRHIFRWGYPGIALHSTASVLMETERRPRRRPSEEGGRDGPTAAVVGYTWSPKSQRRQRPSQHPSEVACHLGFRLLASRAERT